MIRTGIGALTGTLIVLAVAVLAAPARPDKGADVWPDAGWPTVSIPGLSADQFAAFQVAVSACWAADPATDLALTIAFDLDPAARVSGEIRLIRHAPGPAWQVEASFQRARRAVLRCQGTGYPLPPEAFAVWRVVEATFAPVPALR